LCPKCNHHHRIGSEEYFEIIFDDNKYTELFENIKSKGPDGTTRDLGTLSFKIQ